MSTPLTIAAEAAELTRRHEHDETEADRAALARRLRDQTYHENLDLAIDAARLALGVTFADQITWTPNPSATPVGHLPELSPTYELSLGWKNTPTTPEPRLTVVGTGGRGVCGWIEELADLHHWIIRN